MKKIGIVGWNTGENSFGVTKPYLEWLSQFGDVEILTPKKGIVEDLDLLILPGGLDLNPVASNAVPSYFTSNSDVMKQYFYDQNLDKYLEIGTPIFGICLGFQQLCTKFGGTLVQNFPFDYSTKGRNELVDKLNVTQYIKVTGEIKVNSLHHQGCFDLAEEMVIARERTYKNIEVARFNATTYGVQYHPEEIYDDISKCIINLLLKNNE
jgi:putative glutamine amidotransferase